MQLQTGTILKNHCECIQRHNIGDSHSHDIGVACQSQENYQINRILFTTQVHMIIVVQCVGFFYDNR